MKKLFTSRVFLLIWLMICVAAAISLNKHLADVSRAEERLQLAEQHAEQLAQENEKKKAEIMRAQTPFEREQMIREQLGMQKPGESVVEVIENTPVATGVAEIQTRPSLNVPSSSASSFLTIQRVVRECVSFIQSALAQFGSRLGGFFSRQEKI